MEIKELGVVKEAKIKLTDLLIFTGKNNTGKTYISYMLYGVLSYLREVSFEFINEEDMKLLFDKMKDNEISFSISLSDIESEIHQKAIKELKINLKEIAIQNFRLKASEFNNLEIEISDDTIYDFYKVKQNLYQNIELEFDNFIFHQKYDEKGKKISFKFINKSIKEFNFDNFKLYCEVLINGGLLDRPKNVFYIPAERTGINVFKNELNEGRLKAYDAMINTMQYATLKDKKAKSKIEKKMIYDNLSLVLGSERSSYPKPISDYINFLNEMRDNINELEEDEDKKTGNYIRDEILHGKYEIDDRDASVSFRQRHGKKQYKTKTIPFHVVSSSIKSLYGLDYFLDNISKEGDYIIIDEPELSLHIENQRKLANVFYQLVKNGYKVILSTHSDIFIRELTNIVLEDKINAKNEYLEDRIKIYNFENSTMEDLGPIELIELFKNFDDISIEIDNKYAELIYRMEQKNNGR